MLTETSRTLDEVSPTQIFRDFFQWVPFNVVIKGAEKMPDRRQREYKADTKAAKQKGNRRKAAVVAHHRRK
jgi:hypothetical protein